MDELREQLRQAEERARQAQQQLLHEQERTRQSNERLRRTTFDEYVRAYYEYFSLPLRAAHPSQSTKGSIPAPIGRLCPTELRHWTELHAEQTLIYDKVRSYMQPEDEVIARRIDSLEVLKGIARSLCRYPISSEKSLEMIEQGGKNTIVHDIIDALRQNPAAQSEFNLGAGVRFDSHSNALEPDTINEEGQPSTESAPSTRKKQPDSFCIYREAEERSKMILTAEYKPPHKLVGKRWSFMKRSLRRKARNCDITRRSLLVQRWCRSTM